MKRWVGSLPAWPRRLLYVPPTCPSPKTSTPAPPPRALPILLPTTCPLYRPRRIWILGGPDFVHVPLEWNVGPCRQVPRRTQRDARTRGFDDTPFKLELTKLTRAYSSQPSLHRCHSLGICARCRRLGNHEIRAPHRLTAAEIDEQKEWIARAIR